MRFSLVIFIAVAASLLVFAASSAQGSSDGQTCSCPAASTSALVSGAVDDCCCSVEVVDNVNNHLRPVLEELMHTTYFRHYKLNLFRRCKIFPEDGQCMFRTCAVEECEEAEWKQIWEEEEEEETKEEPEFSRVNSFIETNTFHKWTDDGDPWTNDMSTEEQDFHYIDLAKNPERFTGYSGPNAARIWSAIYGENCFKAPDGNPDPTTNKDVCIEKRAFYRLISGLHTSITTHLSYDFLMDADKGIWAPNYKMFVQRVGNFPQRIKNMYFTYLFLLRATTKIAPLLVDWNYHTPTVDERQKIKSLMEKMSETVTLSCPATFDETLMFQGPDSESLKRQFKSRFRNISEVLDCVTCEKCRLWGKIQINGLGVALKILFEMSESDLEKAGPAMKLQRTEIVALLNTLNRFSESVKWSQEMYEMYQRDQELEKQKQQQSNSKEDGSSVAGTSTSTSASAQTKKESSNISSSGSQTVKDVELAQPGNSTASHYLVMLGLLTPAAFVLLWALSTSKASTK